MSEFPTTASPELLTRAHRIQQILKWCVYGLLLVNYIFYLSEDASRASFTLTAESGFLDWTSAFATSIDMTAWLLLLAMFEIETYVLEDSSWTRWKLNAVHAVRLVCFVLIAHTVYAFSNTVYDFSKTQPIENASSLCDLVNDDLYFVFNLEYTDITKETCTDLSNAEEFYLVGIDPVVSDMKGLALERKLAWADLAEAAIWLVILLAIELVIRLQERNIISGRWFLTLNVIPTMGYVILLSISVWWAALSHWLYLWDQVVWIGGFAAINFNIQQWRQEIRNEEQVKPLSSSSTTP